MDGKRGGEGDGTVVIGGISHFNLNMTNDNEVSVKAYGIDMSPIEENRDVSADDGILRVFERSASNPRNQGKRKLNFDEQDDVEKENFRNSVPELDNIRTNVEDLNSKKLQQELNIRQEKIDELTKRLEYYTKNSKNNDYSSPRFMEPEYMRHERSRNQLLTAENVFYEIVKIFENTERLYEQYTEKFDNLIDIDSKEQNTIEPLPQHHSKQIDNFSKDDDLQLLQTLNQISTLASKARKNLSTVCLLVNSTTSPPTLSDSQIQKEKRLLHVKSDHQLFLIKDLTEEVTKVIDRARDTKEEFDERNREEGNRDLGRFMKDMGEYVQHLEQLFGELIDRSAMIIDNSDLIEKNYIRLLSIANGKSDQKKKIDEMHALNEENLRTILKLRKELICTKRAKQNPVPQLNLEKMENEFSRPQSAIQESHHESGPQHMTSSLKSNKNVDSFLSNRLQEAEKKIERLTDLLNEKENINDALENEIMRKDEALRNFHSTMESTHEKDFSDKQVLNQELQKQRKEYRAQIDQLTSELDSKRAECKTLANELTYKEKLIRENKTHYDPEYNSHQLKDENSKLSREIMILKDEISKFKTHTNQLYKEIDGYKTSLVSYEKHVEKLKKLNDDLNTALSEEREINVRGRDRVHDQMMRMSSKVSELEGYSHTIENSTKDTTSMAKKAEYYLGKIAELREYIVGEAFTARSQKAPGTVRSNLSGVFSSCAKNPMEMYTADEGLETTLTDIRAKVDDMKGKIFNYQNAINRLQGEKQQMYQTLNQMKLEKSPNGFATPVTRAGYTSVKKSQNTFQSTKDTEKSEAMIEYLRAEISHLRDKNKALDAAFEDYKSKAHKTQVKTSQSQMQNFMNEILRPGKDLIYQL